MSFQSVDSAAAVGVIILGVAPLASLRGKVVLLTFLDDTCMADCPLIAQEFRQAGQLLAADSGRVELVAINYNPLYTRVSYIQSFDNEERMAAVPNWLYLTAAAPAWRMSGGTTACPPRRSLQPGR